MEIERLELTETLKAGNEVWVKGTVFDRKDGFPSAIITEINAHKQGKSRAIRVLMTKGDVDKEKARIRDMEAAKNAADKGRDQALTDLKKLEDLYHEAKDQLAAANAQLAAANAQLDALKGELLLGGLGAKKGKS